MIETILLDRFKTKQDYAFLFENINFFGSDTQIIKCIEELSELIAALAKYKNEKSLDNIDKITEEMADSLITIQQIIIILTDQKIVRNKIEQKIARQKKRLEEYHQNSH